MNQKLSIITASFNSEKTIKETIASVLQQSNSDFEYIIVDGKSSDSTTKIIKSFEPLFKEKGISFQWISEPDNGIYNAFNKGIKLSKGDWISFLGSDDCYTKEAISRFFETIKNEKVALDILHSDIHLIGEQQTNIPKKSSWKWNSFKRNMTLVHVGSFHNRMYFNKFGLYDESFRIAGDYELLLRAKSSLKTKKIDGISVEMKIDGISNQQVINVFKETKRAKIKNKVVSKFTANLDYLIWLFKFRIKKKINALVR